MGRLSALWLGFALIALFGSTRPHASPLGCPSYGCEGTHSFDTQLPISALRSDGRPPSVLYLNSTVTSFPANTSSGCAFNAHGTITCMIPTPGATLISFAALNASGTGPFLQWMHEDVASPTTPLMVGIGNVLAFDTRLLVGYTPSGDLALRTALYASGTVWSLGASTADGFMVMLFAQGSLATVLENGTPIASVWLNDTIDGVPGVWSPSGPPAVLNRRFYFVTRWKPSFDGVGPARAGARAVAGGSRMRLYAYDVHASISNRTTLAWHMDLLAALALDEQEEDEVVPCQVTVIEAGAAAAGPIVVLSATTTSRHDVDIDTGNALLGIVDTGPKPSVLWQVPASTLGVAAGLSTDLTSAHEPVPDASSGHPCLWVLGGDGLYKIDAVSGAVREIIELGGAVVTSRLLVGRLESDTTHTVLLWAQSMDGAFSVVAFDATAGATMWTVPLPSSVQDVSGQLSLGKSTDLPGGWAVVALTDAGIVVIG